MDKLLHKTIQLNCQQTYISTPNSISTNQHAYLESLLTSVCMDHRSTQKMRHCGFKVIVNKLLEHIQNK